MGLIKAALGSIGGVMADQWKEYFYCEAIPENVLAVKGQKKTTKRSSNTKGDENIITNGSVILYYNGATEAAVAMGDSLKMHYSVIKKIRPEMIAGFYAEANDEFRWLESSHIDPSLITANCSFRTPSPARAAI